MLFNNLNLTENILAVLAEMGFIEPTEIQEKCIPLILTKKDVV
ncbi:MAG: DEAD/DEAH box helicase [Clostridia bacterium]|jgi:ATP-dependent RNA helicase DeaD